MTTATVKKPRKRLIRGDILRNGPGVSLTFISDESDIIAVPSWVRDLPSFRQWVHSDEVPERLPLGFFNGEIWIDMSKEQIFTHIGVKGEYTMVLRSLSKADRRGQFLMDGLLLTNIEANLSCNPDGTYYLKETLATERIRLIEGKQGGFVEIEGTPDMVLEIVSESSVKKDLITLRELYWKAGIPEYWLVNVRGDDVMFEIYRHTAKNYAAHRKHDGWIRSQVFAKSFRLVREQDESGHPQFTLEVK